MTLIVTAARRALLLVFLASTAGAAYAWWRDREQDSIAPAEWPPITPPTSAPASAAPSSSDNPTAASFVNDLVDAPEARSTDGGAAGWIAPLEDGSCPLTHPVKANDNSGIFHVPDGRFYDRTKAERCYSNTEAAAADGYRQAKS